MPLTFRMSSDDALYFYNFSWTYLEWFSICTTATKLPNFKGEYFQNYIDKSYCFVVCTLPYDDLCFYEVLWKYPDRFSINRADTQLLLSIF